MRTYEFDMVLKDLAEITDEQADALFAAGCDDGTPVSRNGSPGFTSTAKACHWKRPFARPLHRFRPPVSTSARSNWMWTPRYSRHLEGNMAKLCYPASKQYRRRKRKRLCPFPAPQNYWRSSKNTSS